MATSERARWAGRNSAKEVVRAEAWRALEDAGVDWARVRPDQFADIPVLQALRASIEARKGAR